MQNKTVAARFPTFLNRIPLTMLHSIICLLTWFAISLGACSTMRAQNNDDTSSQSEVARLPAADSLEDASPWTAPEPLVERLMERGDEFNYVESAVPDFQLPDSLRFESGRRVTDANQWSERRSELLELFRQQVYGVRPQQTGDVEFKVTEEVSDAFDGTATGRSVTATVSLDDRQFSFPFVVFTPNDAPKPVPAVIHINNRYRIPLPKAIAEEDPFWPARMMIEQGLATASFHTSDVDPDNANRYEEGIRAFVVDGEPPEEHAWRSLSAWGWGASRILDYLETLGVVDAGRVAVSGHSRGGKAALWAACEDQRFAIAYSNNSGCGGAALSRRRYGETVGRITGSFPHWFCPPFAEYADNEDELPIDQHQVFALIAPRAAYVASAGDDLWADPKGEYTALVSAAPVFESLGEQAIDEPSMPPLDSQRATGQTGYHIRSGGHGLGLIDWASFLHFAKVVWE